MHLDFDRLVLTDFKTFEGTHVFSLIDYRNGLHFIRGRNDKHKRMGPNGTGKSTLLVDAISWCLFGQTVDGLKNTDVKPWHFKGKTSVGLSITVGKDKHSILRTINPNRLTLDRRDVGQEQIDRLIRMGFRLCTNTILLAQGQQLFFDMTPKDKMQLFVDALGLDRWDARATAANKRVAMLGNKVSEYNGEALGLATSLQTVERLISETQTKSSQWEEEWHARTRGAKKELESCEKACEAAIRSRDTSDAALDGAEVEVRALAKLLDKTFSEVNDASKAYATEKARETELRAQHVEKKNELAELGEGNTCPRCGQSLRGTGLEKHKRLLVQEIDDIHDAIRKGISPKVVKAVEAADKKLVATRTHLLKFQKKADEARDQLDTRQKLVAELEGRRKALKETMAQKEEEANPYRGQIKTLSTKRKDIMDEIKDCADDVVHTEKQIERAKFWTKGFKDIRLFVMEEIMEELELATNAMLDEAGLVGWRVAYLIERETARGAIAHGMSIMVKSPESDGMVKWESWSGGEAQRLRVVGALALSEVLLNHAGVTPSMEVLDEPTQHLSPEGVKDLCEYLSDRAHRLHRQIWYVDHQSVESTRFESVTTIRRDGGGSHIVKSG